MTFGEECDLHLLLENHTHRELIWLHIVNERKAICTVISKSPFCQVTFQGHINIHSSGWWYEYICSMTGESKGRKQKNLLDEESINKVTVSIYFCFILQNYQLHDSLQSKYKDKDWLFFYYGLLVQKNLLKGSIKQSFLTATVSTVFYQTCTEWWKLENPWNKPTVCLLTYLWESAVESQSDQFKTKLENVLVLEILQWKKYYGM